MSGFDEGKFTYDERDDLMRDVRDYTSRLDLSTPPVDLVAQIRETTARDIHGVPESPVGSGTSPSQGAAGSSAACSSAGTPSDRTLRGLRRLAIVTQGEVRDVAHSDDYHNLVEYAYAVANKQHRSRSEAENIKIILNTFKEAMWLPEAQQWKDASEREMKSLQDLNVYTPVPRSAVPSGKKDVGTKWVYKVKPNNTFKARLVAQGWNQVPGNDCGSTFSPVCRIRSIRMVLAIAAEQEWEVIQLDMKTIFLYADIEEDALAGMAPGFETTDKEGVRFVIKLGKSLYGLA